MPSSRKDNRDKSCPPGETDGPQAPDWKDGLKKLYDSVVEEPLPDSFKELLSKLDDNSK